MKTKAAFNHYYLSISLTILYKTKEKLTTYLCINLPIYVGISSIILWCMKLISYEKSKI